jgi:Fe2+ transport system protein FeoA
MKLSNLHIGDQAIIKNIETNDELKSRLFSFGVGRGSKLTIEACSIRQKTIEIEVDGTLIGLRGKEAEEIEVEKIS